MRSAYGRTGSVVALCGGIGGAKLALGLSHVVPADRLSIIVNTGDDFRHLGLHVSPDIDTVTYTLAGRANRETGWGREGDTWRFMDAVAELGGETWFRLGDTDLATSTVRTMRLEAGDRLTDITRDNARALGVEAAILPITDDPLATIVETEEGPLGFQRYFVQRKCEPRVRGVRYEGAAQARITPEVAAALSRADLSAILLCPSNPYLSIDPMQAVPDFRACLKAADAPIVAVSPIVGGRSVKGPLAKMMREAGLDVSPRSIAQHYEGLVDVLIVDEEDRDLDIEGIQVHVAQTVMHSLEDRISLAREVLGVAYRAEERHDR